MVELIKHDAGYATGCVSMLAGNPCQTVNILTKPCEGSDFVKGYSVIGALPQTIATSCSEVNDAVEIGVYCKTLQRVRSP